MTKTKCVFCGVEQEDYKGVYLMKNDGSANYYSSHKCVINHTKLKRDKKKIRWTEAFHITREKRIARRSEMADKLKKERDAKLARKEARRSEKKDVKKVESSVNK
jgi:ribosomal protein L24E